ncbi:MAG: endonuclease/exonuclease/phosphatase family protein [Rhizobiaceae bacterium]
MRLAAYNVENLFDRAKAMNLETWDDGRVVLEKHAELNRLLGETNYTAASKTRMIALMVELGLEKSDLGPFVILRRNRGNLLKRPRSGGLEITADGRADWIGSLELRDEPINEIATQNTARVLVELDADVLGVVEAENRPSLLDFSNIVVPAVGGTPFRHIMVIDGNDTRGIDVGLVTKAGFPIGNIKSRVDDRSANGEPVFSRDCPQFEVSTPDGNRLIVLVNHFKSKGFGSTASSNARRKLQAERVRDIYNELKAAGEDNVAVLGDLNDTPDSNPLEPLIEGTDLKDIALHPSFDDAGFPGTFGLGNAANKIDYVLLSPNLFARVTAGGVFRKGVWPGSRPARWPVFAELKKPEQAASDHAAVWADIDI